MKKYLLLMLLFFIIPNSAQAATNWDEFVNDLETDDAVIELENDITGSSNIVITKDKTINLNGYSISTSGTITVDGADVSINEGKITSTAGNTLSIINGGVVNLNSSTIENTDYGSYSIYIKGASTDNGVKTKLIIDKNSTVSANFALGIQRNSTASYGVVVDIYGSIIGENTINTYNYGAVGIHVFSNIKQLEGNVPEINIYEGANVIAKQGNTGDLNADDAPAIYAEGYAKWNITGGTIKGSEAITAFAGEYNITGGELIGMGIFHELQLESNKSIATGSAIALIENSYFPGNIVLNVSSANITSEQASAIRSLISDTAKDNSISGINLVGGRYTGKVNAVKVPTYDKFISGGCYSSVPEDNYLKSAELSIVEIDNYYCIGMKNKVLIDDKSEKFIKSNLNEAIAGQTVTITSKKVNGYKISNLIVKTISGELVEVTDNTFIMPAEDVVIEVDYVEDVTNPNTSDNIYLAFISVIVSFVALGILKHLKNVYEK